MSMDENAEGSNEASIRKVNDARRNRGSRRQLLRQMAGISLGLPLARWGALPALAQISAGSPKSPSSQTTLSPEDEQFLDELEHTTFLYFWEQANPQTGLIKDRCNVRTPDSSVVASIASTGFGLTAICIAEKRGFISHQE